MFPNGNVGLENSKFYEDVPARGHNACAGRHELQVPQITKRLHKDSARPMSLILKALPLATDDFRLGPRQSTHGRADSLSRFQVAMCLRGHSRPIRRQRQRTREQARTGYLSSNSLWCPLLAQSGRSCALGLRSEVWR